MDDNQSPLAAPSEPISESYRAEEDDFTHFFNPLSNFIVKT